MIEFKNVDLIFGKRPQRGLALIDDGYDRTRLQAETGLVLGVRDVNLRVEKGEICVLMGLSGSGKSSLLRCVNGLNTVTRGQVLIDQGDGQAVDFTHASDATQRDFCMKRIAMVFQRFALMPWLTVAENVGFALEMQKLPKEEIERRVDAQLELVGLSGWRNHKPSALSGGMQQRVGLARALATESDILLMDEPFSALDPLIRQQLQDELLELQEKLQKTIIFVSHDLDEALKLGNNIAIMKDGVIVQQGKPQDIVLNPADDYVEDFVAHTNPLHVLRGRDVAQPLAEHRQENGRYCIDESQNCWFDPTDKQLYRDNEVVAVQQWQEGEAIESLAAVPTRVSGQCRFRDIMEVRYRTGCAVLVEEGGETLVVGDTELYKSLLGQRAA
ncbi:choline ABC transporter ATP-binding protein [Saccharospirillum mangrovi]|uniref:choline ABC transporter ATP-binding protein n=1 Tax=Saccharospirillum mangrovi TaxID=2161747 RepID=UPI000D3547DB|nr:choline ABC transporter ATP-binding protein [Saccharospirillum mangrovi]